MQAFLDYSQYLVVAIYSVACLFGIGVWRNHEVGSSGAGFATLVTYFDRRSWNHPDPEGRKSKRRDMMRGLAVPVLLKTLKTLLWSFAVGVALLFATVLAAITLRALSTEKWSAFYDLLPETLQRLVLGFVDASTFDLFIVAGVDVSLIDGNVFYRAVTFLFVLSAVSIVGQTFWSALRNLLVLLCCLIFPLNTIEAADNRATKNAFQKFLHAVLGLKVPTDPVEGMFRGL
jgi:hypothetical protein